jgi:hypothetical protein
MTLKKYCFFSSHISICGILWKLFAAGEPQSLALNKKLNIEYPNLECSKYMLK